MRAKRIILSLGAISLATLPIFIASCSRYSVKEHNEINDVIKGFINRESYLENSMPKDEIKIPSQTETLKIKYEYYYFAGSIDWSTKVGDQEYNDTIWGWKQYPDLELINYDKTQNKIPWGSAQTSLGIDSSLQLNIIANSYAPYQYIDISTLMQGAKDYVSTQLKDVLKSIINDTMVDKWTNVGIDEQKKAIDEAVNQHGVISKDKVDESIKNENMNDILAMFTILPGNNQQRLLSNFLNYNELINSIGPTPTYDAEIQYLTNWAEEKNNKNSLNKIFTLFKDFKYDDFINVIKDLNN